LIETLDLNVNSNRVWYYVRWINVLGDVWISFDGVSRVTTPFRFSHIVSFNSHVESVVIGSTDSRDNFLVLDQLERRSVISSNKAKELHGSNFIMASKLLNPIYIYFDERCIGIFF